MHGAKATMVPRMPRPYHADRATPVQLIGHSKLQDRWWDGERQAVRWNWRVMAADSQVFELYHENGVRWVLDVV